MRCLIQYIDGLDLMPVITSLLPWNTLIPENRATDVVLQQSSRSKIKGSNGDWSLETDGKIEQISQKSHVKTQIREQEYHQRNTTIESHDTTKIDGNQVNEIMGALKTVIGEKALILALDNIMLGRKKEIQLQSTENMTLESLKTFEEKAAELAKIKGETVWLGNDSLNVLQVLLDLITIVKGMNTALATHAHKSGGSGVPIQATAFTGYKSDSST
ncbi:MAG: hypothetical protein HRT53_20430 [Colwellia sp.]|nr:hypothetical protein [Colwellia sp.]